MWAYCDTSALVKRYVREPGRRALMQILARHDCVSSALLPVELRGAFRRRVSEGALDASQVPKLLERVTSDRAYWTLVEVTADVLTAAETLIATHPLRTLDAIHVASAQMFAARVPASLLFVSADRRQNDAAAAIGLSVRRIGFDGSARFRKGRCSKTVCSSEGWLANSGSRAIKTSGGAVLTFTLLSGAAVRNCLRRMKVASSIPRIILRSAMVGIGPLRGSYGGTRPI